MWCLRGALLLLTGCTGSAGLRSLEDAHNYSVDLDVALPRAAAAEYSDVLLDWSGLTQDMLGQDFDPLAASTKAVVVVFPGLSAAEVEEQVAADALSQSSVGLYVSCAPDDAACAMSELTVGGTDADTETFFAAGSGTWLVGVLSVSDTEDAARHRWLQFLEPTPESTETTLDMSATEGRFDVGVAFSSQTLEVSSPWPVLDWSGLTLTGVGNALSIHRIDQLILSAYTDTTPEALAADFVNIEALAASSWQVEVGGSVGVDLDEVEDFPGFDEEHLWLVGLRCSTCPSPIPWFAGIVEWGD